MFEHIYWKPAPTGREDEELEEVSSGFTGNWGQYAVDGGVVYDSSALDQPVVLSKDNWPRGVEADVEDWEFSSHGPAEHMHIIIHKADDLLVAKFSAEPLDEFQ